MVTTLTFAPVSFSKPAMTLSAVLFEFWAAQMVRVTPSSLVFCAGQVADAAGVAAGAGVAASGEDERGGGRDGDGAAPFQAFFIELLLVCDVAP